MTNNPEIIHRIRESIEKHQWKYTFDDKKKVINLTFSIPGKVPRIKLLMDLSYEDSYVVICFFPICAGEEIYPQLLMLINYINYSAKFGNFEMNDHDGEVRYRMSVDCEGIIPSDEMIDRSILIPISMMKKYGGYIIDIIFEFKTFDEVRTILEKEDV